MPYHTSGKQTICFNYLLLAVIFMLLPGLYFTGCTNDPLVDIPTLETEDEISLKLSIEIPSVNKPVTRAMSTEDEGAIEKIDVLVFRVEGTTETFAYRTHNSSQPTTEDNYVKFMVSLKKSEATESYRLVMLANLRDEVDAALETIQEGDAKEQVLAAITFSQDASWPTGSDHKRLIPMWGETTEHAIINRSTTLQSFGGNISMLRALARIDVSLQLGEGSEIPGFEISRIKVYNAHTTHAAVPGPGSGFSIQNQKVTSPTIVSDARIDPPLVYALTGTERSSGLSGEIYIGEAANEEADIPEATCLLIEGYYTKPGEEKNTDTPTWYRIDFRVPGSEEPLQNRLDILRNHIYQININYVGGPGYDDEDEAFRTGPYNLITDIIVWSEGVINDVVWNGQYMLGVSSSLFEKDRESSLTTLTVTTNYPDGWIPSVEEAYEEWLSIDSHQFTGINEHDPLTFAVTTNNSGAERIGYIHLVAGNLTLPLKVVQSLAGEVSIQVTDANGNPVETLWFDALSPVQQTLQVTWKPTDNDCMPATGSGIAGTEAIDFSLGDDPASATMTGGSHIFSLQPAAITGTIPFEERTSRLYFTTGGSTPVSATVLVRQVSYELLAETQENYDLDGHSHSFLIRTNADWTAEIIDDPDQVVTAYETSGVRSVAERHFAFTLKESDIANTTATFRFQLTGDFGPAVTQEVTILAGSSNSGENTRVVGLANCYLVDPEGYTLFIPVEQANADGNIRITDGMELNATFIWTDQPGGLSPNGCVAAISVDGKGPDAMLHVTSGNVSGNAVVAVTNTAGTILWSWHIWVTDFHPDNDNNDRYTYRSYQFLDRNLGALDETPGSQKALGFYYQWGRKDPFPSASGINSNSFATIYDENGTITSITTQATGNQGYGSGDNNLEMSIQNPTTYITNWGCWYTNDYQAIENRVMRRFWNDGETLEDGKKAVYDPCPEGWRVVPGDLGGNIAWYDLFSSVSFDSNTNTYLVSSEDSNISLGYWPAAGQITGTNFALEQVGSLGNYWTGNIVTGGSTSGIRFEFLSDGNAHPGLERNRSAGLPIRCMRKLE